MTGGAFRCAAASAARAEPLAGTASTVRAFLLVEAPGPWGIDAVGSSRLPDEVRQRLAWLRSEHGLRPLMIRGHGGRRAGTTRVFASYVDDDRPWTRTVRLDDARELLDLDLTGLAAGSLPGLVDHDDPLFLVCTHGRHDVCCAERGRPLSAALHAVAPEETWEVSHIGGDRFAGNVLVLPHGLYYGRLVPDDVPHLVAEHRAGRVDLDHLRGRSSRSFAVQAAEIHLRRHLGMLDLAGPALVEARRTGEETRAVFDARGGRWVVRVRTTRGPAEQLTCRGEAPSGGLCHRVTALEPAD